MFDSQCIDLLKHLKAGNTITVAQGLSKLGIGDLRRRICDLRDRGHIIDDEWVTKKGRNGRKTRFKKYFLVKENSCA